MGTEEVKAVFYDGLDCSDLAFPNASVVTSLWRCKLPFTIDVIQSGGYFFEGYIGFLIFGSSKVSASVTPEFLAWAADALESSNGIFHAGRVEVRQKLNMSGTGVHTRENYILAFFCRCGSARGFAFGYAIWSENVHTCLGKGRSTVQAILREIAHHLLG